MSAAGRPTVTLAYQDVPPSLNRLGTRGSHWEVGKAKRRWQEILEGLLLGSGLPRGLTSVEASALLRFPVVRRRDSGNFSWLIEKALGDSLVRGGWLADDTADEFRFFGVEFDSELGPARTVITVIGRLA